MNNTLSLLVSIQDILPLYCAPLAQLDRAVTFTIGVTGWRFKSSTGNYFKQMQLKFKKLVVSRNQNAFTPHALWKCGQRQQLQLMQNSMSIIRIEVCLMLQFSRKNPYSLTININILLKYLMLTSSQIGFILLSRRSCFSMSLLICQKIHDIQVQYHWCFFQTKEHTFIGVFL
ncbi:Hypothetical_protein [Hexamita inflata]|uniref:Hypothetical_protein n=1 Tax=Hexamita inflata TaxID=28002 RepID=A0AA86NI25_9EUKA|nr:Hypothetical protein HINF_LOCUS7118 [Hexamita inflata]